MSSPTTDNAKSMTRCPVCPELISQDNRHYPFCSARCKTIDLGRWVDEEYKISRPIEQRDLEEGVD